MKSFVFRGALAWNHLPKALKDIPSLLDFKNVLKGTKIRLANDSMVPDEVS